METNNYKVELQLYNQPKAKQQIRKIAWKICVLLCSSRKNYSHSVLNVNGRQSESVLFVNSFILHLITKLLFVFFP